ncbi:MAG: CheR family methyltransferase [Bryobacteraceae bacterium]
MGSPRRTETTLSAAALLRLQELASERLGMEKRPGRELLLNVRTGRHMRELGVADPAEYMGLLESDRTGARMRELMDLLTTNHTAFWREPGHFEWLRERLTGGWLGAGRQTIWCAASSSGEEPYTLAMVAREALGPAAARSIRILATDVSTRMLEAARTGIYSRERIRPLPEAWQRQYFEPGNNRMRDHFRVKAEIRGMVHIRQLNLVEPIPRIGPFPVIFCRNVMIYFSKETRMRIVRDLLRRLTPDGFLLVGYAEGLSGLEAETDYVSPAVYRRKPNAAAASQGGNK